MDRQKEGYERFKYSACFSCPYCKEEKLAEINANELDVRKNGIVKTWCYAVNDVVAVMWPIEKEECPFYIQVENAK